MTFFQKVLNIWLKNPNLKERIIALTNEIKDDPQFRQELERNLLDIKTAIANNDHDLALVFIAGLYAQGMIYAEKLAKAKDSFEYKN